MKLDRLLSRIRAALQDYASEFEQRALAAEYAEWCAKAAQRLEQIVPLIREGQDFPALQIAESAPPVLDLVRQLSFAEADQWRAFCRQRGLSAPQPFDERSVDLVNQLYGKKIGETHPLYREYRQAIRTRNEEQALHVLQSIRRVNPDDANAHAEFARVSRKLFARRSVELAAALDQGDASRVLSLMDTFETDDLPGREQDPTWQRALRFRDEQQLREAHERCLALAAQLRQTRADSQWKDALPLLAEWDTLRGQFNFALPPEIEEETAGIREWAAGLLAGRAREDEHQHLWRDLSTRLEILSQQNPRKKSGKVLAAEVQELTDQAAMLTAQLNSTAGGTPPPPDLIRRLDQEKNLLRQNLRQRRMTLSGLAAAALAGVVAVAAVAVWSHVRNENSQAAVAAIQQQLKDGSATALADTLMNYDAKYGDLSKDPEVVTLLSQARDFVQTHHAAQARFDQELAQITQAAQKPSASQIAGLLTNLDDLDRETGGLGADDAQRAKASVQALRVRLSQELSRDQDARTIQLTDIFTRASKILAEKLAGPVTADAAQPAIQEAQKILAEADQIPAASSAATSSEQEVRAQLAALAKKLDALAGAVRDALAGRALLPQIRSLADYGAAIEALAANLLQGDPTVAAARTLVAAKPDWTGAAQHILLPGEPEMWAFLKQAADARLQPAENMQNEDMQFTRLTHDDLIGNTYRADLVKYADGVAGTPAPVILAGPPSGDGEPRKFGEKSENEEMRQTGKIINPDGTTSDQSVRWVHFDQTAPSGTRFENVRLASESKLVGRVKQAFDPRTGSIREPLLRVLDDVKANTDASPLLKAYLEQEIFSIMQKRPLDWGLAFSPSAKADALELAKITGNKVRDVDWLFTDNSRETDDLEAFYKRTSGTSYYDEAEKNLQELLKKRNASVGFLGYVDLQQAPQLDEPAPANASLWGLDSSGNWHPLFTVSNGQTARAANSPEPARLTPLLSAQENAASSL